MRSWISLFLSFCVAALVPVKALAQLPAAPDPQKASLVGYAEDSDGAYIPGAVLTLSWQNGEKHITMTADDKGYFDIPGLRAGVPYAVSVTAEGFSKIALPAITLMPGQQFEMDGIRLRPELMTSVDAVSPAELATVQVRAEEQQKVLGFVPNYYVSYAGSQFAPLSRKLKYDLALKSMLSPVNILGAAFLGGLNQASNSPHYGQGAAGYGQRVGAVYAAGASDILLGGAIYPSLFHQDPRYFYQGTGTKKSRALHALMSPFVCKGDNGRQEFNVSSVGGDVTAGALSNIYYPHAERGAGLVLNSAAVITGGRMANALLQEFVLSRFTKRGQ